MNRNSESEFTAELGQLLYARCGAMPEAKALPFMHAAHALLPGQDIARKVARGNLRQRRVEMQDEDCVDAGGRQQAHALGQRRNQTRRRGRAQELLGMRIEGDGKRANAGRTRVGGGRRKNLAVPAVHAVKDADSRDRRAKVLRNFIHRRVDGNGALAGPGCDRAGKNVRCAAHSSMGTVSPSYAMRTPGGSMRLVSSWPRSWAMCVSQVCRAPTRAAHATA